MTTRAKNGHSRRAFLAGSGAVAAGLMFKPRSGWSAEEPRLNFYNWDTYIGETTLSDFQDATGIEVKMDLYADNAELFAKLKAGNPGYDVIVPTNDYVERMIAAEMLVPIDHSKITNIENISPTFQDANFDPGRKFSLPYMWGTIGIGYWKSLVEPAPDSWKWLYDSDKYSGKLSLLGDGGTVIGIAFKYMGHSFNATDPKLFKEAEQLLIKQKPHIRAFAEDNGQDLLLSGEVDLTMEWNGDILQVMPEDEDIGYVLPKEGGLLWQDCMCIPKGAPHPNNAHTFINFILDAEVGAAIADFIRYATPNEAAKALLPAEYTENPAIFPPDEVTARSEPALYLGPDHARLIEETWTRIQAA
jgi:spermidine/putrescine transport system substrate-binding protein